MEHHTLADTVTRQTLSCAVNFAAGGEPVN